MRSGRSYGRGISLARTHAHSDTVEMYREGLTRRWKKKPFHRSPFLSISLFTLFILSLLFVSFRHTPASLFLSAPPQTSSRFPQCHPSPASRDRFLWYAPHSGFSNQLSEFKNAILMAAILNRTLIVPPVLDHHAVALGSCPKFRVSSSSELRISVWDHVVQLIRNGSYVSMAEIIDLSELVSSSAVRTIDFKKFVSLWCGVSFDLTCSSGSDLQASLIERLSQCRSLLSGLDGNVDKCLYALNEDCRSIVWTYGDEGEDGALDQFQPYEQLRKKKKIMHVRRRRDVYKTLGPGSEADLATVLAFGSLFTAPYKGSELYIDIHDSPREQRIESLIKRINFLPFTPEIMSAGKEITKRRIKAPFFCAQLRLLDGQFKNHWKATFLGLREKLESSKKNKPFPVFVMTDLSEGNWSGSYLGELSRSTTFQLHVLSAADPLVIETATKLVAAGQSKKGVNASEITDSVDGMHKACPQKVLPDVLLYIEEAICSCASLGFYGTSGSTIAESIELMRKYGACLDHSGKRH